MNSYRSNATSGWRPGNRGSTTWWSNFSVFAQRRPELLVTGALLGGALLGFMTQGRNAAQQAGGSALRRQPASAAQAPYHTPASRLGATEEQMAKRTPPPAPALESGTAGVTGTAYDLDPASVTPG